MIISYYLGLGSNIEPRRDYLARACVALAPHGRIIRRSGIYRTTPWGVTAQPDFYNAVIEFECALSPHSLLTVLKQIESNLGRVPSPRWGPRQIDIDILFSPQAVISEPTLQIPHPELTNRRFVLGPLAEIAADLVVGTDGTTAADCLAACKDPSEIEKLEINW